MFSHLITSLKRVVRRRVSKKGDDKLPKVSPVVVEPKKHLTNARKVALDNDAWKRRVSMQEPMISMAHCASPLFSGEADTMPSSSPTSSIPSSIFLQDNSSTNTVSTLSFSSSLEVGTSDVDAEMAGHRSKVRRLSETDANSEVEVTDPRMLGLLATPSAFSVVVSARGPGRSRKIETSLMVSSGMNHFEALAKHVAERSVQNHEGMVFLSKVYVGIIHDQASYEEWLEWRSTRPAEDHVLRVLA